jgi:hypothetical protein
VGRIYSILAAAEGDGSFMLDIIDAAILKTVASRIPIAASHPASSVARAPRIPYADDRATQAASSTSDTASATHCAFCLAPQHMIDPSFENSGRPSPPPVRVNDENDIRLADLLQCCSTKGSLMRSSPRMINHAWRCHPFISSPA